MKASELDALPSVPLTEQQRRAEELREARERDQRTLGTHVPDDQQ